MSVKTKNVLVYVCSDSKEFSNREEAQEHECFLMVQMLFPDLTEATWKHMAERFVDNAGQIREVLEFFDKSDQTD